MKTSKESLPTPISPCPCSAVEQYAQPLAQVVEVVERHSELDNKLIVGVSAPQLGLQVDLYPRGSHSAAHGRETLRRA